MSQPITSVRWIQVRNTDTVPVPPFGAMEIAGPIDDEGTVPITRPTKDGQTDVIFNWIGMIPAGGVGQGHQAFPTVAGYSVDNEEGPPPSDGEIWGTKTDEWLLSRERTGFRIVGDGVDGLCNIVRMTANLVLMVQITSTTPNDGRYPAQERYYDPVAKTWTTGNACWWVDANGAAARTNRYYLPMLAGYANGRKVYQSAGGGADASDLITVAEEDGAPSVVASTLKFPNTSLTDNGDGTVSVNLADGDSSTKAGLVSVSQQYLTGTKYIVGNLYSANNGSASKTAEIALKSISGDPRVEAASDSITDGPISLYFLNTPAQPEIILDCPSVVLVPPRITIRHAGIDYTGVTGTGGGGDHYTGGICDTLGSGPSGIDGGTF